MRKILVINCTPYLQEWINQHPFNNDPESPLWVQDNGKLLCYARITAILKQAVKSAGIKKRVYPHLFRHSRATLLANIMSDSALKNYLGWTQGSKMAATYIHMSGKETDNSILEMNGIQISKEKKDSKMKPKQCLRCKTINEATNRFCRLCGLILDEEEANRILEKDSETQKGDQFMKEVVSDSELLKLLIGKIREKGLDKILN
jgi:integrase/recombinase XerD